jgi:hypothetical protein
MYSRSHGVTLHRTTVCFLIHMTVTQECGWNAPDSVWNYSSTCRCCVQKYSRYFPRSVSAKCSVSRLPVIMSSILSQKTTQPLPCSVSCLWRQTSIHITYKPSVSTSQITHSVSVIPHESLDASYRKIILVYYHSYSKHINTLCTKLLAGSRDVSARRFVQLGVGDPHGHLTKGYLISVVIESRDLWW